MARVKLFFHPNIDLPYTDIEEKGAFILNERLKERYPLLTKTQQKVADFFFSHESEPAFLSIGELAHQTKTSKATIVRFSRAIGFKGYPALQQELRNLVRQKISPSKILQSLIVHETKDDFYAKIFQMDLQNLSETKETNRKETLDQSIKEILRAKRIGFVGFETSHAIAYLLYFYIGRVRTNCELLEQGWMLVNQLMNYGADDLLIAVSFPRYSRQALETVKYGKRMGSRIVAITDSPVSPIAQVADIVLLAGRRTATYFNSYTSAVTLVNCLVAGVSLKKRGSLKSLKSFDQIQKQWNIFLR
jgi:DNA-binding MurR/RpiR family transcriptional regulator